MGSSPSKVLEPNGGVGDQLRAEESTAASTGSLPILRNAFSRLSRDDALRSIPPAALEEVFSLTVLNIQSESGLLPECFPMILANFGPCLVDLFFQKDESGVDWLNFLKGYNHCCQRFSLSASLNILFKVYSASSRKTQSPVNLNFDSNEDDCKITGDIKLNELLMLLWMCWIMEYISRTRFSKKKLSVVLPDMNHLVTSAFISCNNIGDDLTIMNPEVFHLDMNVSIQKLQLWILSTIPGLAHCIAQFVLVRLQSATALEDHPEAELFMAAPNDHLLNRGSAWAITLSHRSATMELLGACFARKHKEEMDNLLYRSSMHGKGLSRFWFHIEGYHGPLLILVAASSENTVEIDFRCKKWIFAILTGQGIENKDAFYGSSGFLFSLSPIFRMFPSSGKDKNFIYCHLHPSVKVYDPNPKPVGLAFGGTVGNERIFIDEDFAKVRIRHHAVDKTYLPGRLVPNQGFLPTEAAVLDVEVWGLGGKSAKEHQDTFKKRESIFSEQRRKVDLKTFMTWEDSPEKMMLDMVSDPNAVRREDR